MRAIWRANAFRQSRLAILGCGALTLLASSLTMAELVSRPLAAPMTMAAPQRSESRSSRVAPIDERCREITTASTVGISNGLLSLTFDRRTGALISLRNEVAKDEYLKQPGQEGNPFRIYVDAAKLPPPRQQTLTGGAAKSKAIWEGVSSRQPTAACSPASFGAKMPQAASFSPFDTPIPL